LLESDLGLNLDPAAGVLLVQQCLAAAQVVHYLVLHQSPRDDAMGSQAAAW